MGEVGASPTLTRNGNSRIPRLKPEYPPLPCAVRPSRIKETSVNTHRWLAVLFFEQPSSHTTASGNPHHPSIWAAFWRGNFMKHLLLLALLLAVLIPVGPAVAQDAPICVEDYDESVDYFANKVEPVHAEGFTVEYFNHYKVVNVVTPWIGATEEDAFTYVLVQCGTPVPDGFDDAQIIELPVESVIAMSTTQLPHLVELGVVDTLVGLDSTLYVNSPAVLELIDNEALVEVGFGADVNIEVVLDVEPDVVMSSGSGIPEYDVHPVLLDNDVPAVINAEWVENSPLARAEWIKFTSTFFNAEAAANEYFENVEAEYQELVALTADIEDSPTVLTGSFFSDTWTIAGTESFVGQYIADAGADLVFAEHEDVAGNPASAFFDFETVYLDGLEADYWLPNAFGVSSVEDLLAQDERYADFVAVEAGNVYADSNRVNENGGNDIFESGVINPHIVLMDLIKIFHPDLLPDHELVYYKKL
jgi:iron complex transport system substrate-binding protein